MFDELNAQLRPANKKQERKQRCGASTSGTCWCKLRSLTCRHVGRSNGCEIADSHLCTIALSGKPLGIIEHRSIGKACRVCKRMAYGRRGQGCKRQ